MIKLQKVCIDKTSLIHFFEFPFFYDFSIYFWHFCQAGVYHVISVVLSPLVHRLWNIKIICFLDQYCTCILDPVSMIFFSSSIGLEHNFVSFPFTFRGAKMGKAYTPVFSHQGGGVCELSSVLWVKVNLCGSSFFFIFKAKILELKKMKR